MSCKADVNTVIQWMLGIMASLTMPALLPLLFHLCNYKDLNLPKVCPGKVFNTPGCLLHNDLISCNS